MKRIQTIMVVIVALLATSCGNKSMKSLPNSIGKPYELLVISPDGTYSGQVGDTLKTIFGKEVEMINISEPLYDVISVTPEKMTTTLKRHRNILNLKINDKQYPTTTMDSKLSELADDQVIINITSPSADSLAKYIADNGKLIIGYYDKFERDRFMTKAAKYRNEDIDKVIKEKFGFTMDIPSTYKIRDSKENFLWISYELPLASLGLVIYTFTPEGETFNLLAERNAAVNQIPGPSEGSYMRTDTTFMPMHESIAFSGKNWIESRGFWSVQNDFMGGPFVNFTTEEANGKMLGIDCYVFSPSNSSKMGGMRNYLRQLEALALTIKFDNAK